MEKQNNETLKDIAMLLKGDYKEVLLRTIKNKNKNKKKKTLKESFC